MKVQIDKLVQSARGEILCEFCGRQWFGLVAYCPYCGRKPGFTMVTQAAGDRPASDKASAGRQVELPAGKLHSEKELSSRNEATATPFLRMPTPAENMSELHDGGPKSLPNEHRAMPIEGAPAAGGNIFPEQHKPLPSRWGEGASTLLFKLAVAGLSALLLFWIGFQLLAPKTDEGVSPPQPPASTPGGASTSAAPVPPPRTDTAAPAQSTATQTPPSPPRTDTTVPPPANRGPLCSAANEAAGLCKPQG